MVDNSNKNGNRRKRSAAKSGGISPSQENFLKVLTKKYPDLSPIELQLCLMIRERMPSWQIAEKLSVKEHTIENHRSDIRRKLKLKFGRSLENFLLTF